jgi:hypothetical protein
MSNVSIRPLRREDTPASASLHLEVLETEFLARCGNGFLHSYHLAWLESPVSLALAAVDARGEIVGVLLGSLEPATHIRTMVRRRGLPLALRLVARAVSCPNFAREFVATRAARYARGIVRMLIAELATLGRRHQIPRPHRPHSDGDITTTLPTAATHSDGKITAPSVGEVTHLMVREDARGSGVGRALLEEARTVCERAGLTELVLVTPPDLAAHTFYEHLGWRRTGELRSRSGEPFIRYRLPLDP